MKKILVVDDDQDILMAVRLTLESEGFTAETTTKGEEAFSMVKSFKPDLILLDLLLSGNDGSHICRKLKEDKTTQKIPVVMMSAHPTAKQSAKECDAEGFVAKPFSIENLISEINRLT
jgi:DNA-binding response OmpR family regulator